MKTIILSVMAAILLGMPAGPLSAGDAEPAELNSESAAAADPPTVRHSEEFLAEMRARHEEIKKRHQALQKEMEQIGRLEDQISGREYPSKLGDSLKVRWVARQLLATTGGRLVTHRNDRTAVAVKLPEDCSLEEVKSAVGRMIEQSASLDVAFDWQEMPGDYVAENSEKPQAIILEDSEGLWLLLGYSAEKPAVIIKLIDTDFDMGFAGQRPSSGARRDR